MESTARVFNPTDGPVRISEHPDALSSGNRLMEKLQAFHVEFAAKDAHTGNIAARPSHTRGEAAIDQIVRRSNNGDCCSRAPCRVNAGITEHDDYIHALSNEFANERLISVVMPLCP
jgi:hypothetical protein